MAQTTCGAQERSNFEENVFLEQSATQGDLEKQRVAHERGTMMWSYQKYFSSLRHLLGDLRHSYSTWLVSHPLICSPQSMADVKFMSEPTKGLESLTNVFEGIWESPRAVQLQVEANEIQTGVHIVALLQIR